MNLRDKILGCQDRKEKLVDVPEWGVQVLVRSMSAGERGELLDAIRAADGTTRVGRMHLLVAMKTAYDPETKQRIFEDLDQDALGAKLAGAVDRIAEVGMMLSGMTQAVQEAMEKNSGKASGLSSSDSPAS